MAIENHDPVKLQKMAGTVAALTAYELVLPNLFRQESFDNYVGAQGDTLTFRVPGTLPGRDYGWRNNRSAPIVWDVYEESTVAVTIGGHAYSGIRLTDEQSKMDFQGFGRVHAAQTRAVARTINQKASDCVINAPYEVDIAVNPTSAGGLRKGILEARRVLNRFGVPQANRILVAGTDVENLMLQDDKLVDAQHVGDNIAEGSLRDAAIGRVYGFTVVVDPNLPGDAAYVFGEDAFIGATAAPGVPAGYFGGSASELGVAMRFLRDYDTDNLRERSVVSTFYGFRATLDAYRYWDAEATPPKEDHGPRDEDDNVEQRFVRGVKLHLDETSTDTVADSTYPDADDSLNLITKVTPTGWEAPDPGE